MSDTVIQRVLFRAQPSTAALYFQLASPAGPVPRASVAPDPRTLVLPAGSTLHTCTYFNGLFEGHWRRSTQVGDLSLHLVVSGHATVGLRRRSAQGSDQLLDSLDVDGDGCAIELRVPSAADDVEESILYFTVEAFSSVTVQDGAWVAHGTDPRPVQLAVGFCTFNREAPLLRNLGALQDDPDLVEHLQRIIVVDQGSNRVRLHPGFAGVENASVPVRLVEQGNFGGSGGFTRCILEASAMPRVTHMILMDDDAVVEPEGVFRCAAFLALARQELAIAGQMLDLTRPTQLVEAGGTVCPKLLSLTTPAPTGLALQYSDELVQLTSHRPLDYGSWFSFAFPLALVDRLGLPMPLFIRGDDAEFGCRMTTAGVPIVTVPGIAVWHHPWYARERGWYIYYNIRNTLILSAAHFATSRWARFVSNLRLIIMSLLVRHYYTAWLNVEAMRAYTRGPRILACNPRSNHQRLLEAGRKLAAATLPRSQVLSQLQPPPPPRTRLGRMWLLFKSVVGNLLWRSPAPNSPPPTSI